MTGGSRFLGAVLAGGRSSRFGSDKALANLGGERLLDRAVRILRDVCDDVIVVSSHPEHEGANWLRIPDLRVGMGPLAGIESALQHATSTGSAGVVVVACDLPGVETDALRTLMDELGDADAVARERDGPPGFEPLCAVYRTRCLSSATVLLDEGTRGAHHLLSAVEGRTARLVGPALVNVNTRDDLEKMKRPRDRGPAAPRDDVDVGRDDANAGPDDADAGPTVVCVVGKKKSGKTTTVVGLVAELARRGHDVMTVKHGHGFDLDREGSDSWKHRHIGGASRVVLAGPDGFAVMGGWPARDGGEPPLEELVRRHLRDADIVIAEGFKASRFPRIEVFRRIAHVAPLLGGQDGGVPERYLGVLTDDPTLQAPCPVWNVDDPDRFTTLADVVEALHLRRSPGRER